MIWSIDMLSPSMIRVVSGGSLSASGTASMLEDLFAFPQWKPRISILFDNRQLEIKKTNVMEWLAAGDVLYRRNPELAYSKVAVLVATLNDFQLTQRFDKIIKYRMSSITKIFMVEKEAIDWLAEFTDVSDENGWD